MLIHNRESFDTARSVLLDSDILTIDTETNFTDHWHDKYLMGIAFHCPLKGREQFEISYYFPFRHEHNKALFPEDNLPIEWFQELRCVLERPSVPQIYHNAKFDLEILRREGIKINTTVWDTMLMSHMTDETKFSHALEALANQFFGIDAHIEKKALRQISKDLGGWEKVPPQVMDKYACKDVLITWKLYNELKLLMEKEEQLDIYPDEEILMYALGEIERNGALIDVDLAKQYSESSQSRLTELRASLGFDPMKPSQLARRLYQTPPEGLGLLPVGQPSKRPLSPSIRLATGKELTKIPVMDEHTLKRYDCQEISDVLEYRGLVKADATWYAGFLGKVDLDGRLHAGYKQHGTVTTRLSCAEPNLQQIPRRDDDNDSPVKRLFKAREGFELWEFDFSQIEYRLAAAYSEEESILEAYRNGVDFHTLTAQKMGIDRNSAAKHINFAISYGSGPQGLVDTFWKLAKKDITQTQAKLYIDEFWEQYPKLQSTVRYAERVARTRKYVKLWNGRRRRFRFPSEAHKAFNSIIQGGAFQIIAKPLRDLYLMKDKDFYVVNQIHDAIWVEIPITNLEKDKEIIKNTLEWTGDKFPINFPIEMKKLA